LAIICTSHEAESGFGACLTNAEYGCIILLQEYVFNLTIIYENISSSTEYSANFLAPELIFSNVSFSDLYVFYF
jgi:hypothetical protein